MPARKLPVLGRSFVGTFAGALKVDGALTFTTLRDKLNEHTRPFFISILVGSPRAGGFFSELV